ncbi:hypothetical protein CEY16_12805 [Halalkalibacillus sediminis]|uniref:CamS family sex pheromone protein n=1 Tax=Halalkalibacillus sediminis TaxID=2018042 RepID=A0A2I0QQS6_9BACI|nr:CamS family sex pheromone protein [Halalkalibacillus sediminis]PKR76692.1 hypothetical protein CEY16_12805 [Halalkalibacillus sediminis]
MRKFTIIFILTGFALAGCAPDYEQEDEVIQETDETMDEQRFIVPNNNLSEDNYSTILPYQPSAARGVITNQVANRYDIDELEQGLIRQSKDYFDTEEYLFQEGQYISGDEALNWIESNTLSDEQLQEYLVEPNPDVTMEALREGEEAGVWKPRILSHILEQNYLVRAEESRVELAGVSIGIAVKSQFTYQTEIGGPTYYGDIPEEYILEHGKEIADDILKKVRNKEALQEVPVVIALYKENERGAIKPGNFMQKTYVEPLDMTTNEWESVNEQYVLFPSNQAEEEYYEHAEMMQDFTNGVSDYFPNYIGVVGNGFYIDDELQELSINIPIEFQGKQEVVGFTQHIYGLIQEHFPNYFDVEVTVESPTKQESVITKDAGDEEPFVHIYQ